MAKKKPQDFILTHWPDIAQEGLLSAAFKKKTSWMIHSPPSLAVRYSTILSNLECQYIKPEPATVEVIRNTLNRGLSRNAFERLKQITRVSNENLGRVISVPARTLARREKFKPDESERILRVASAFQKTLEVFGDLDQARRWFSAPKRALGKKTPLEYCDTELGAQEVEHLLGRIEHGVFT